MNRTGIAGSTLGTLVLGALLLRTAVSPSVSPTAPVVSPPTATPSATPQGSDESNSAKEDGPWKASQAHFAGMVSASQCPPQAHWCIPDDQRVQAMIAIVPDPVHSHLALVYDRTVEAIQLAAQSEKYVVDRYWLPWDISRAQGADYASRQLAGKVQQQREMQPGLLLFRWNGPSEDAKEKKTASVLYVFLVTDTSTAGINGEQFSNAVDYVHEVCTRAPGCVESGPVRIMGPTFSGSLASLRQLVEARNRQSGGIPQKFIAYSGAVSSLCALRNQGLLEDERLKKEADDLCPAASYTQTQNLSVRPFVSSTELGFKRFIELLKTEHDINCEGVPEVALLSEASTAYGQATPAHPEQKQKGMPTKPLPGKSKGDCYTNFSYPREIASLRNASQAAAKGGPAPASSPQPSSPYLPLNLADPTNSSDEPPDFSISQGPLSKEAVLMNFASELRRGHYKYIGISGTNILDVLFLTAFLRKAVPDARLFVADSDLLLERDIDNAPYIGTLAITTYPLILRNLDWPHPQPGLPRLPFSDQYEEGLYNASLSTIKEMVSREGDSAAPYDCGSPDCSQPPVWLTVVGTGGYWPVQILSASSSSGTGAKTETGVDPPAPSLSGSPGPIAGANLTRKDFTGGWTITAALLCALAVLHCGVLLMAWPVSVTFRDFSLLNPEPQQRLFFIQAASASLAVALALAGSPVWRSELHGLEQWLDVVLDLAIAGLVATSGLVEINFLLRWSRYKEDQHRVSAQTFAWHLVFSIFVWVVAAVAIWMWQTLFAHDISNYGLFFSYRVVHLATGVSPLIPILALLAAVYLWAISEIWRLRFNERIRPRLNPVTGRDSQEKLRPGFNQEQLIASAIRRYSLGITFNVCFGLVLAVWSWFFDPHHAFDLFEKPNFGILYEISLCVVVALILSCGFRVALIWRQLKQLLTDLNRSPARFTFNRLSDIGWSSIWRQGSEEVEWDYAARSREIVQQLGQDGRELSLDLKNGAAELDTKFKDFDRKRKQLQEPPGNFLPAVRTTLEGVGRPSWKKVKESGEYLDCIQGIQESLAKVLGSVLDILDKSWQDHFPAAKENESQEKDSQPLYIDCREDENSQTGYRVVTLSGPDGNYPNAKRRNLLEEYVALRYIAFFRAVLSRIRLLLIFLAVSFSLLLISLNVYAFEPHRTLTWSITAIFAVVGFISVVVLMQAHRDPILSRITGTQANKLDLTFYVRIATLGAVPLLTLLSTHFPAIGRFLISLVQPGLDALK